MVSWNINDNLLFIIYQKTSGGNWVSFNVQMKKINVETKKASGATLTLFAD